MVASRDVDTHPINTDGRVCTLINIWERKTKQESIKWLNHHKNIWVFIFCHYLPQQQGAEQWLVLCISQSWELFTSSLLLLRSFYTLSNFLSSLGHKQSIIGAGSWTVVLTSLTCAVASTPVQFVTNVTFTSKKSWNILAASIDTDVSKGTFVYVCKRDRERERMIKRGRGRERERGPAVRD